MNKTTEAIKLMKSALHTALNSYEIPMTAGIAEALTAANKAIAQAEQREPVSQEPLMITPGGGAFPFVVVGEQAEGEEPVKHTTADNYEHFLSYMRAAGARHNALLCKAYFDGAGASHEEYEAYIDSRPEKNHSGEVTNMVDEALNAPNLFGQVYLICRFNGNSHEGSMQAANEAVKEHGEDAVSKQDLSLIVEQIVRG